MRLLVCMLLSLMLSEQLAAQQVTGRTSSTINLDGTVFYYTAEKDGEMLLYEAQKSTSGVWMSGVPVESFNTAFKSSLATIASPFITYDNQTLYFSGKVAGETKFDLYYATRQGDKWGKPVKLYNVNTEANESNPSLSADNIHLYFTRKAQGGDDDLMYCNTIYHALRTPSGGWLSPTPVDFPVNTGCETTPVISPDGKTLFFASDRLSQKKKRKFAIHYSTQLASDVWSTPMPVDSLVKEYDEFYPTMDYKNKEMQITRLETNKKDPLGALYSFSLPDNFFKLNMAQVSGRVTNVSGQPLQCSIKVYDSHTLKPISLLNSSADGSYRFIVPTGRQFTAEFFADTTTHIFTNITTDKIGDGASLKYDIVLFASINLALEILDANTMETTAAKLTVKEEGAKKALFQKEIDGRTNLLLPINKQYELLVEKTGFVPKSIKMQINGQQQFADLKQVVFLEPELRAGELHVLDAVNNTPLETHIDIRNLDRKEMVSANKIQTGRYTFNLRKDSRYELSIFQKGYMYFLSNWGVDASRVKQTMDVKLVPLSGLGKLELQSLAFKYGTTEMDAAAWAELKSLARLLKENPEYNFVLSMPTADNDAAKKLATQRLFVIQVYLNKQALPVNNYTTETSVIKAATSSAKEPMEKLSIHATKRILE